MTIIGIGNILQKDDGFGVYASAYLKKNYTFSKKVNIIEGGVEGIHLLNTLEESKQILILDCIQIDDKPSSIYAIPAKELSGYGLNNGGAHEIGIIQCMDMLELQGKTIPKAMLIGIVPSKVTFEISLSPIIFNAFDDYIKVVLQYLKKQGIDYLINDELFSLEDIIGVFGCDNSKR
jgi:hydrogenase maturation protease